MKTLKRIGYFLRQIGECFVPCFFQPSIKWLSNALAVQHFKATLNSAEVARLANLLGSETRLSAHCGISIIFFKYFFF